MSCEFPDIFSLYNISDHNYFVTTTSDKFGIVLIDIESIDIVIMQVFIVFDYQVLRRFIQCNASILRSSHAILSISVESYDVNRCIMNFTTRFKGNRQFVLRLLTFFVLLTSKHSIPNNKVGNWSTLRKLKQILSLFLYNFKNNLSNRQQIIKQSIQQTALMNFQQQSGNLPEDQQTQKLMQELSTQKQQTPEQISQKKKIPENMCNQGRQLLQKKQYLQASKSFSKSVIAFQFLLKNQSLSKDQIIRMMKDFIMPAYSNLALCHLKLGNYDSVLVYANQTLIQDNSNIKAFYRRGMAYKGLKQFEQAICDFTSLKKLSHTDQVLAQQMINQCKICIQQQKQRQKKFASNLIKNYSYDNDKNSKQQEKKPQKAGFISTISQCLKKTCNKLIFWK